MSTSIVYVVDRDDILVSVGGAWEQCAADGQAPGLMRAMVLGRSIWSLISDATTRALYDGFFERVRYGRSFDLPLRCDLPDRERHLRLRLRPLAEHSIECVSDVVMERRRAPVRLWEAAVPRTTDMLVVCSWCQRVRVDVTWQSAEEAVARLQLFDQLRLPRMTHTICPGCEAAALRQLESGQT